MTLLWRLLVRRLNLKCGLHSHWVMFAEDMMKKTVARLRELATAAESHHLLSAFNLCEHLWPWNLPNLETACRHLTV